MKAAWLNNFLKGTARESVRALVANGSQFSYTCIGRKTGHLCSESTPEVPEEFLLCIHHLYTKIFVTGSVKCQSQEFSSGL